MMAPDTQELVLNSLDAALAQQVAQLFDVVMADPSDEGLGRFMAGLNRAVGVHTRLRDTLAPDECTASDSSGSSP